MEYKTQTPSVEAKRSTVSNAIEDLDPVIERAAQYAGRLQKLHDKVNGPRPAEVMKDSAPTPPHSIITSINQRRSRLVDILDDMERTINGLEGSL